MAKQPNRIPSRIRPVPIAQMFVPNVYVTQREFSKAQGDSIASDLDLDKIGFPIVNHRDGKYWILDGQHRIYGLRKNGFEGDNLDCEVYEGLTDAEAAKIFLGRDERRQVEPYAKFMLSCTAGFQRELDIRRTVEANGQKISRNRNNSSDGISAVGALRNVYDRSGEAVLGQVIRAINLGFGGDSRAFDRAMIEGLGLVFHRYNGRTNEKALGQRLSGLRQGARELLRKAETIHDRTGIAKKHCVAAATVDIYNKGEAPTAKTRLPSWWKEAE